MDREEIMSVIHSLAKSQGCWSRLYFELCNLYEENFEGFDEYMSELESMNFTNRLDLVLFLEGNY